MKIIKYIIITTIVLTVIINSSCNKNNDSINCIEHTVSECNEDSSKINIRIKNVSEYDFCNVILRNENCGRIKKGQATCYRAFNSGYKYDFVELEIDGNTFTIQPIDFVGEIPLEKGYYTYQINSNDSQEQYGRLSLTFVED